MLGRRNEGLQRRERRADDYGRGGKIGRGRLPPTVRQLSAINLKLWAAYDSFNTKMFRYGDGYLAIVGSAAHELALQDALNELKKQPQ